jgi:adenylate cyclase
MQPRTIRRIRAVALVTPLAAALGAAFAARSAEGGADVALGAAVGGISGLALASLEIAIQGPAAATLRRLPLLLVLALRVAVYWAVFVAANRAGAGLVASFGADVPPHAGMLTGSSVLISIAASVAFNLFFVLRALLGGRALMSLLTGQYRRPREEQRIVLFLDLQGSTQIAERIGNAAFHGFLDRVFGDITDPILAAGGEIYRYVGDEIIVTWPFARGVRDGACVACIVAIDDALVRQRDDYQRAFGVMPRLRSVLHAGPLIVGEMGDVKREIVMLGDVMNTAARIEEVCRATGHDIIASAAVLPAMRSLPPGLRAQSLGPVSLRGKADAIELFALLRAGRGLGADAPPG